jgi:ABC-type branched-subunit amino acid transport system ATPase component
VRRESDESDDATHHATQRVYLIEKGAIKHESRSSDLRNDAAARLRYLGV